MSEHRWSYCHHCQVPMVVCGKCGNNGCNGGHGGEGTEWCDACPSAYDKQCAESDAAFEVADAVMKWRSIETAPKDGTRILLRVPYRANTYKAATIVRFGRWHDTSWVFEARGGLYAQDATIIAWAAAPE